MGCGSSFYAGLYANYFFEEFAGLPCEFEMADEFIKRRAIIEAGTAFVMISQSGETGDLLRATKKIKKSLAITISVVNQEQSSLARLSDIFIYDLAGQEKALAATKSFTAQLVVLSLLAVYFAQELGKNKKAQIDVIKALKLIPNKIKDILDNEKIIKKVAQGLKNKETLTILGGAYHFPIALETALKIKETTYIKAEAQASGEFKHGPIATLSKKSSVLFFFLRDGLQKEHKNLLNDIKNITNNIILIANKGCRSAQKFSKNIIFIPRSLDALQPVLSVVAIQLLAYHIALARKINIDNPRNLNKFVK